MTRTYARDAQHYDRTVLAHLVETGQATFFAAANTYVVKTENGSFAVRPHQIVDSGLTVPVTVEVADVVEVRVTSPMDGYACKEQYDLEDAGPGGLVYDSAVALAEEYVAAFGLTTDPLVFVRRILDDEDGEYRLKLRDEIDDHRRFAPKRRGVLSAAQQELLRDFL